MSPQKRALAVQLCVKLLSGPDSLHQMMLFTAPENLVMTGKYLHSCGVHQIQSACACALQARAEDFCETLAFVRLLNALWKASGPSIYDGGRPYAHFTQYVLHTILTPINHRRYK